MSDTNEKREPSRGSELPAVRPGKAAVASTLAAAEATQQVIGEASKKVEKAEKPVKSPTVEIPAKDGFVTQDQLKAVLEANNEGIMRSNLMASADIAERVSKSVADQAVREAVPEIRKEMEFAMNRKMKMAAGRTHGMTVLTAVAVFAFGSLAKVGYEYMNKGSSAE